MLLSRQLFASRVARRIFLAFALASLLPLALFAWLTLSQVSKDLEQSGLHKVRELAKRTGMATFNQLTIVRGQMQLAVQLSEPEQALKLLSENEDLARRVKQLFWLTPDAEHPELAPQLRRKLSEQMLVLQRQPGLRPHSRLFLSLPNAKGARLVAEMNTELLWNSAGVANINEVVCLIDQTGQAAYCNQEVGKDWTTRLYQAAIGGESGRRLNDPQHGALLSSVWGLFLKPHYNIPYWYFAAGVRKADLLAPIQQFQKWFPLVVVLVLSVSLWLGIYFVRGNLRPLERLLAAAQRLGQGDFAVRAEVHSKDEFEQLGSAFDQAAQNLGKNFQNLQAMAELEQGLRNVEQDEQVLQLGMRAVSDISGGQARALLSDRRTKQWLALLPQPGGDDAHRVILPQGELPTQQCACELSLLAQTYPVFLHLGLPPDAQLELLPIAARGDSDRVLLLVLANPNLDDNDRVLLRQIIELLDRTLQNHALNQQLYFQAKHDPLTGLLNRIGLRDRFSSMSEAAQAHRQGLAVMIFDLDRFKDINDSLGHAAGDQLLVEIADRVSGQLQNLPGAVASRFSGDEFVLLSNCPANTPVEGHVRDLVQAVEAVFAPPFLLGQRQFAISASKGVTLCMGSSCDYQSLLQQADLAMYHAKRSQRGTFSLYDDSLAVALKQRLSLEEALRHALSRNQLKVFYQPIVDQQKGQIRAAEALIRWERDGQLVSPALFIPVVEEMGLIHEFGEWVFAQVCADLARWQLPPDSFYASVNLSALQVEHPGLVSRFTEILDDSGIDRRSLVLEITETAVMQNAKSGFAVLEELRAMGLQLLVDDFGTGHASLKYLRNLPIDGIKVDKMFVDHLPESPKDTAIVSSLAVLAKDLGIRVVVEGVEYDSQREWLLQTGLPVMQGYLFSKPLPVGKFEAEWLSDFQLPSEQASVL